MNILVVNGSPRKMVCHAFVTELENMAKEYAHKVDVVNLVDYNIAYCQACEGCRQTDACVLKDDYTSVIEPKLREADLVIFATPNYFANVSGMMKVFMDRTYSLYNLIGSKEVKYSVFIAAESDYYGCMSVYERVKEYAEMMGMEEKCDPYFQMNKEEMFYVDDKLKNHIAELLMKTIYVDVDTVDDDEAMAEIDD